MNTPSEVTQGRQQVPPVPVQMTPSTWEGCEGELRKSLPKTAKEPENQPDHRQPCQTRADHSTEAEYPPGGEDGQPTSFLQEISECHFGAGWIKYTSATGVTEQPVPA